LEQGQALQSEIRQEDHPKNELSPDVGPGVRLMEETEEEGGGREGGREGEKK